MFQNFNGGVEQEETYSQKCLPVKLFPQESPASQEGHHGPATGGRFWNETPKPKLHSTIDKNVSELGHTPMPL